MRGQTNKLTARIGNLSNQAVIGGRLHTKALHGLVRGCLGIREQLGHRDGRRFMVRLKLRSKLTNGTVGFKSVLRLQMLNRRGGNALAEACKYLSRLHRRQLIGIPDQQKLRMGQQAIQ